MAKLPSVHARDALKAFERLGWIHRRTTASHWIMSKTWANASVVGAVS
jgi:predicted RNA binding protein YcfA (HicA-like mRNA interferase family)